MPAKFRASSLLFALALVVAAGAAIAVRRAFRNGGATETIGAKGTKNVGASTPIDGGDRGDGATGSSATDAVRQLDLPNAASASPSFPSLDWKPGPPSGFAVLVVDARTRKPIANAHLVVVPKRGRETEPSLDELLKRVTADARGFASDEKGIARVEWPAGPAWVVGNADERRGARELVAPGRDDFELPLAPRRSVVVEIVNAHGKPLVGARVGWASRDGSGRVRSLQSEVAVDFQGRARLDRPDKAVAGLGIAVPFAGERGREPAAFVELGQAAGGNAGPDELESGPDTTTIHCVVPGEYGAIALRLLDETGQLSSEEAEIVFRRVDRGQRRREGGSTSPLEDLIEDLMLSIDSQILTGGSGTFAPVPLGHVFHIDARRSRQRCATRVALGPRTDGETVRVELTEPGSICHIHGRLSGVARPTEVCVSFDGGFDRSNFDEQDSGPGSNEGELPRPLRVGEDGRFEFDTKTVLDAGPEELNFIGLDESSGEGFEAEASLRQGLSTADVDLGDVHVRVLRIVASGRVRSRTGEPLPRVVVKLSDDERRTDASGRFLFLGEIQGRRSQLHIDPQGGFAGATLDFHIGARDLEIVLEREGGIAGRLLADRELTLFAQPRDGGEPRGPRQVLERRGPRAASPPSRLDEPLHDVDRPFTIVLDPGRYDVCVSLGGGTPEAAVILTIADVEVVAGQTTCDPRLNPVDLRGAIFRWRFTLARSDGAPPPSTWVRLAPPDRDGDYQQTLYVGSDAVSCDSALESAWIDVARPGFRHIHELHERGDVKLVLEPVDSHPIDVHVSLPADARTAALAWRVRAEPSWTAPVEGLDWFSAPVGEDGTARIDLDEEGAPWRLRLYAVAHKNDQEKRCEISRLARVLRNRDFQRGPVELRVEPDDLATALAALEPQH